MVVDYRNKGVTGQLYYGDLSPFFLNCCGGRGKVRIDSQLLPSERLVTNIVESNNTIGVGSNAPPFVVPNLEFAPSFLKADGTFLIVLPKMASAKRDKIPTIGW
jgi:hypothetical protein